MRRRNLLVGILAVAMLLLSAGLVSAAPEKECATFGGFGGFYKICYKANIIKQSVDGDGKVHKNFVFLYDLFFSPAGEDFEKLGTFKSIFHTLDGEGTLVAGRLGEYNCVYKFTDSGVTVNCNV